MGRGQLLFKGEKKKKKKKSKYSLKADDDEQVVSRVAVAPVPVIEKPVAATAASCATETNEQETPQVRKGTGHITTSGTVVSGYETLFEKQVTIGDALLVQIIGGQQEMRVVTMRLSNVSLNLSTAFSSDLKSPTDFHYIGKPRDKQKERQLAAKKAKLSQSELEAQAFGTYASQDLVYREKTETGSYRIKREKASVDSRGDLLHLRAKKTSDKYC
jgi:hypothetical protein